MYTVIILIMDKNKAYDLFEEMIVEAKAKLMEFTLNSKLSINQKVDKSLVTTCDKQIDQKLTEIAYKSGLKVVSEEGEHTLNIVKSGNYITIDPIDGTLGYIDHVNYALEQGNIRKFIQKDLGPEHDFCLLLGIVKGGKPRFAACYNFITGEKILLDSENRENFIRLNNTRNYNQTNVVYLDQRFIDDPITQELIKSSDVSQIKQATFGLKSLYTIINSHINAITLHRVQPAGLWDVMPAAVAAQVFGGEIFDEIGNPLKLNDYIVLPGNGGIVIKGDKFKFVLDKLNS